MPIVLGPDRLLLPTGETGAFCVKASLSSGGGEHVVAHLASMAGELVDPAAADVALDLAGPAIVLRFDPEPGNVDLDGARASLDVVATREDEGTTAAAPGLALTLTNEAGAVLATATTGPSGRAKLGFEPGRSGAAGPGSFKVSFAGSADAAPATRSVPVLRRTAVELTALDAHDGTLAPACSEEGAPIRVSATPSCARAGCAAEA